MYSNYFNCKLIMSKIQKYGQSENIGNLNLTGHSSKVTQL